MAKPTVLQVSWAGGMVQDLPRHQIPDDAAWDLVNYVPNHDRGPLSRRRGWTWTGNSISAVAASVARLPIVGGTPQNSIPIGIDEHGGVWNTSAGTFAGSTGGTPLIKPIVFSEKYIVTSASTGLTKPYHTDISNIPSVSSISAAPTGAMFGTVYKERLLLANSSSGGTGDIANRIWFSSVGDPLTWDLSNSFIDSSNQEVRGLWALRDQVLVFSGANTERLTGAVPPPGTDMELKPLFNVGCPHQNSLAGTEDFVVFANEEGVYMTDGFSLEDLTQTGGIKQYWVNNGPGAALRNWNGYTAAGYIYLGYYIISIVSVPPAATEYTLVCDLARRVWFRFTNLLFRSYATAGLSTKFQAGSASFSRNADLATMFAATANLVADYRDGDESTISASLHTRYYQPDGFNEKRFNFLYLDYDMKKVQSIDSTVDVAYEKPLSTWTNTYTSAGSLSTTSASSVGQSVVGRRRLPLRFASPGFSLRVTNTNGARFLRLFGVEADVAAYERSRLKQ